MSRSKRDLTDPYVQITPNQIVAYNLAEARALRGWTQEQAAAELEEYVGSRWSKATFSAAERFDASDLTEAQDRAAWRAEDALEAVVMKELARFDEWRRAPDRAGQPAPLLAEPRESQGRAREPHQEGGG